MTSPLLPKLAYSRTDNALLFESLTIFECKTPYLGNDVMVFYLQLVVRDWVISVKLIVVCSRGPTR